MDRSHNERAGECSAVVADAEMVIVVVIRRPGLSVLNVSVCVISRGTCGRCDARPAWARASLGRGRAGENQACSPRARLPVMSQT